MWTWGTTHALNSSKEANYYWGIAFFGGPIQLKGPKQDEAVLASLGTVHGMKCCGIREVQHRPIL